LITPLSPTGVFFGEQSVESLCRAMLAYEAAEHEFVPSAIRRHASRFSFASFDESFREFIAEKIGFHRQQGSTIPSRLERPLAVGR
jgi:hypothetical protein